MTGKTLKELNAQVGDVVEYTFGNNVCPVKYGPLEDWWLSIAFLWDEAEKPYWHVISRATNYTDWKFCTAPDGADTHVMPDGSVAWRVKIEPEIGSMTVYFSDRFKFTYTTIDSIPDCASVKMELLE